MPNKSKLDQWLEIQLERVEGIHNWYLEHFINTSIEDPIIKYIVLWSVFNALYNVFDLPNNRIPDRINGRYRFRNKFGYFTPIINNNSDSERINKFAEKLSNIDSFKLLINREEVKSCLIFFVERMPSVIQDESIDVNHVIPIILQDDSQKWVVEDEFFPAKIRGVASLDRRLFIADGYKFFDYSSIDNPWNNEGELINILVTTQHLLSVLYQLRNNTVHGGSTAYDAKDIIPYGHAILEAVIQFIFENREEIYKGEK